MKKHPLTTISLAAALVLPTLPAPALGLPTLREAEYYLASPELGGRLTGSDGESSAAAFIARRLESAGVRPLPGLGSLIVPFEFTAGMNDAGTMLTVAHTERPGEAQTFTTNTQVQALSFSDSTEVSGPLVFAGYGIRTGDESSVKYDSFEGLDLKDKIVLILRYYPEDVGETTRTELRQRVSELRTKAQNARERGAKGLLVTAGPRGPQGSDIVAMTYDAAASGSGIAAASISTSAALELFRVAGRAPGELGQIQKRLDAGETNLNGLDLSKAVVTLTTKVSRERKAAHNILGYLPANDPASTTTNEYVAVGAHYDHLGDGKRVGNSLAHTSEQGQPHVGADDNASGVAAVLDIAERLSTATLRRPVLFGLWTGEEIGTLGSTDFVKNGPVKPKDIVAYVNLDMVGRAKDNKLTIMGVGSSSVWPRLVEQANAPTSFTVSGVQDPYVPSDASPFYVAGVPILNFFTGSHADYHRPTDTPDKINYPDLERVARVAAAAVKLTADLGAKPDYLKVERKGGLAGGGGGRANLRAYVGAIPDFSAEVKGVKFSGTIDGSPAATAGIREGDVVVELAGRRVTNIYEYMNVLEPLKAGQTVKVVVQRDGRDQELSITLGSRK